LAPPFRGHRTRRLLPVVVPLAVLGFIFNASHGFR
jgi:hypothetical protein